MKKPSLNHIYRTIWSEALNAWVAVSELTSAKGKRLASGILKKALSASALCAGSFTSRNEISRIRPITLALILCFGVEAYANPIGAQVVNGTAAISQAGNTLTVTNSPNAIINWQGFGINPNETTNFVQQSATSAVLNRVVGPDPSQLLGALTSNGKVFLVNPAGILVGQGARIDVAGFVASTLNLSNEDFLAGKLNFTSLLPQAGEGVRVVNQGSITTPDGGTVYLVAPRVENQGIISTPQGETLLAAGNTVQLVDTGTPGVTVQITGAGNTATNLGQILADSGRIGITGAMVRNSGTLNASSLVNEGGRVFLRASQDSYVEGNGRIEASGIKGGSIEVLGNRVAIADNASIDASGQNAGGTVLIGGDYQGKNPGVQNAQVTYFSSAATLSADAMQNGNGGKVIVWADNTTRAYGSISAKGGANGGDGGFVEVSGKGFLDFRAQVDTRAPLGKYGTLLLDPANIIVQAANPDILGTAVSAIDITAATDLNPATNFPGVTSTITSGALAGLLNGADVTLAATNDITVNDIVSWTTSTFALTLDAGNNISINAALDSSGTSGGDIALTAGNAINLGANLVSTFNATAQGMVTLTAGAGGIAQTAGAITANSLKISSGGGVILNGANDINTLAGSVTGTGAFELNSTSALTVGTVLGISGITANNNSISISTAANQTLTIAQPVNAGTGVGSNVLLEADTLALNNTVTADLVSVTPVTANRNITVGSATCNAAPCLNVVDLWRIAAPTIGIGGDAASFSPAGALHVAGITSGGTAVTDRNAVTTRIGLLSGAGVTQAGAIAVADLGVSTGGAVALNATNMVSNLVGYTSAGGFSFNNGQSFRITSVSGGVAPYDYNMSGITALGGDVSLTAAGAASDITANTPGMNFIAIDAFNGNVTLNAGRDVLIGNGVDGRWADIYADGAAKNISITAGRHVLIDNFTYVHSFAGNVTLTATSGNVSIRSSVNGFGTWVGAGTNGTGGVVTINALAGSVLAPAAGFGGDVGGGYISTGSGGTLSVSAKNGIALNGTNAVSSFTASNATTGGVVLTNTSIPLIVNSIVNTGGAVTLTNYGPLTVSTGGIAALGAVTLTSGSAGSTNTADLITLNGTVSGSSVVLAANGVAGTIPAGATVRDLAAVTAVINAVDQTTAATPAVTTVAATTTAANTAATTTTTTAAASTGTATSAPPTAPVVIDTVAVTGTTSGSAFTMVGPAGGTIGGATGTFGGAATPAPAAGAAAEPSNAGSGAADQSDAAGTEEGAQSSAAASTDDSANKDDAAEQNGDNGNGEEHAIEKPEKC